MSRLSEYDYDILFMSLLQNGAKEVLELEEVRKS